MKDKSAQVRASMKYSRTHVKQVKMDLNRKTDADIIAYLESLPNVQGYLKQLIRNDMNSVE